MNSVRTIRMIALPTMIYVAGCAPLDGTNELDLSNLASYDTTAAGTTYEPPMGRNGLKPSEFWSATAQAAYRDMQNFALKDDVGVTIVSGVPIPNLRNPAAGSPLTTLLSTYPKAATDLIECALDSTQVLYDPVNGVEIHGHWGLAPDWYGSPINTKINVQEWLTACMLARLNALGIEVNILLEGEETETAALRNDPALDMAFPFDESTVHGNMFNSIKAVSNSAPAFNAYLCRENYLASACPTDQGAAYARKRICDNVPSLCGLVDIGRCDPTTIPWPTSPACISNGPQHWKCNDGAAGTIHKFRTVGVQLEVPINKNSCY